MQIDLQLKGGDKLAAYLEGLQRAMGSKAPVVKVGFLEGSTCGMNNDADAPSVAFWNEFGTDKIPPRPFFRNTISVNKPTWGKLLGAALKMARYDAPVAMDIVGQKIASQVQDMIEATDSPANAPKYAEQKMKKYGFAKPLEMSKNLKRAVQSQVDGEEPVSPPSGKVR